MEQATETKTRTRRTQQQILELLAEFDKGNFTVKEFCRLKGLSDGVFHKWKSRVRSNISQKEKPTSFAKILVQPVPSDQLFAEVNGIRFYQAVTPAYLKELVS